MEKFLGGLLVTALLSNPFALKNDLFAYQIYQAQGVIIESIKKQQQMEEREIDSQDVEDLFIDVDDNIRNINGLLKDKNNVFGRIHSVMSLKAMTKTALEDYQITAFQEFSEFYSCENEKVNSVLDTVENENILGLRKEALRPEADYEIIYNELKNISDTQFDAIYNLNTIIEEGFKTLEVLY